MVSQVVQEVLQDISNRGQNISQNNGAVDDMNIEIFQNLSVSNSAQSFLFAFRYVYIVKRHNLLEYRSIGIFVISVTSQEILVKT